MTTNFVPHYDEFSKVNFEMILRDFYLQNYPYFHWASIVPFGTIC